MLKVVMTVSKLTIKRGPILLRPETLIKKSGGMFKNSAFWIFGRLLGLVAASGFLCSLGAQQSTSDTPPKPPHRALVEKYCIFCHNDQLKTGGLSLNTISAHDPVENGDVWEKVITKLQHRYMPPVGLPRPDEATYKAAITSLETSLDRQAVEKPDPGRTDTFRRLNRTEYHNAIRDLLDLDVDVSSLLPKDETSQGFDNITVADLSPTLLERYLAAARKISRLAVGSPVPSPGGDTILIPPDLTQEGHISGLPFGTRGGAAVSYNFPLDADYIIRMRLTRDRNELVEGLTEAHQIELTVDGERVGQFTIERPADRDEYQGNVDKHLQVRIPVKAGPHSLGATFLKKTLAFTESERQPYQAFFNYDRHPRTQPALYSLSIEGPYDSTGPGDTPSRQRIFGCYPETLAQEDGCAEHILATLLRRAYRRPVTDADLVGPFKFYRQARAEGGFEAGIEMALRSLLASPNFLFRMELDPVNLVSGSAYRLTDIQLASRLSFFLWSSLPDDELLDMAEEGKLKQPAVLEEQVLRMLKDERSKALVTNFASQWLHLRNLDSITPDPRLFPDFDDNLRQGFRQETELFVDSILREDRSLPELLRANYTFVNERLAKHYGIPHVYGSRFRRVTFDEENGRGGLLSQGSILAVTSYATRTSPVIRGQWILTNILGTPPGIPPPGVPELKEKKHGEKVLSMRERMAEHRTNTVCASCHNLMDPIGFALENYDAIGRWRGSEGGVSVDASGSFPSGAQFEGAAELQHAVLARPELFVTATTEKLLTYALGRGIEYYDAPAIRRIVREARQNDYRFSSIILGVVNSTPFQMRRSQ